MTKAEMLAFLDAQIGALRQRWTAAPTGLAKTKAKNEGAAMTEVRAAIEKHVPADPVPATQPNLKGIA